VGGIIVVEYVFSYPGIGQKLVESVAVRDIKVVQAVGLLIAALYVTLNIVADLAVTYLVPKLRTSA
jgi:peptide/nickel transport system permease protein